MGLTSQSTGKNAFEGNMPAKQEGEFLIALAGNPNVGKSTVQRPDRNAAAYRQLGRQNGFKRGRTV